MSEVSLKGLCDHCREYKTGDVVDEDKLEKAFEYLGSLAKWWLKPSVLKDAKKLNESYFDQYLDAPALSKEPGSCWALCKLNHGWSSMLRGAVLLPLQWQSEQGAHHSLPLQVRDLSKRVIGALKPSLKSYGHDLHEYWLAPHNDSGVGFTRSLNDDLFNKKGSADSAFASLAAGLESAVFKYKVDPSVWASVSWDSDGLKLVDALPEKVELASEWKGVRKIAVHQSQKSEVQDLLREQDNFSIEVVGLGTQNNEDSGKPDLLMSLRKYFSSLFTEPDAPPKPTDSNDQLSAPDFERCARYYESIVDLQKSRKFYTSSLLPNIAASCARKARPRLDDVSHFVSIISYAPEVTLLGAKTVNPDKCLLLFTNESHRYIPYCQQQLGGIGLEPPQLIGKENYVNDVEKHVVAFLKGIDPNKVVLDIKPGTKEMTYALLRVAEPHNRILCIDHEETLNRGPRPGTEHPKVFINQPVTPKKSDPLQS